jgi:asparagine synthase (glutamine-hydrolysing)
MDSSIVLYHMSEHTRGPVKSFTVRFDATEEEGAARFNTDADLAKKTAEVFGADHRELVLTAEMYRDAYEDTARSLDQPNADSVSVAQFLLARMAKEHVDVVLTGAGGDELFGGYPRYRIARIIQALRAIPGPVRGAMGAMFGYPADVLRLNPGPLLAERLLARPESEGLRIARGDWFDGLAARAIFEDHFDALKFSPKLNTGGVRPFMEADRHMWLVDESLRLTDATTMGSGVEARVPFVDERVIAAAHATPGRWHVNFRDTKVLLKETYREILPDHLFTLKKASFYPPLSKWLRREAYPLVERMLEHPRIAEFFNVDELRIIAEEHRTKKAYHLHTLSSLIQLSFWFDTVYDAPRKQ